MRVLMLTGRADVGGGPEHLLQLSRHLPGAVEVFIAAPREAPYWERYVSLVGSQRMFELPHRSLSWSVLRKLDHWCHQNKIELVHSHGRAAGAYSRMLSKTSRAFIHTQHGSLQLKSAKDLIYWMVELLLARRTDHVIAVSKSEGVRLRRGLWLRSRVSVIPNGVAHTDRDARVPARLEPPLRIVHVTRFVPQKNSAMVLEIMKQLRERGALDLFHVDMVGTGPEERALERAAHCAGLGRYITFHGAHPSLSPFLARGFCLVTTSRWEGMPLAVLEAMAVGLPVIASNTAGNNDLINEEVGRLFELASPASAADHLIELASDAQTWKKLSSAAVALVRRAYSVETMAQTTAALYQRVLTSREATRDGFREPTATRQTLHAPRGS